ncbi:Big1p NDAI_0C01710 [Naumovozyma dairenensis CBS 421]|uniref:Protein BIG1 n=1 Tax=Naumovozyma dairenensis (strain ATCC 10597 / BCRC 20456 / CBS 421 / NBRC 0211 / NRRL Y-12639) TaxID=1071378 RepID=G0W7S1_NAUDC|nr:hypothetical protein NDAI_0C01710 [Naumovozyma dairenensis CBS 421]CCD23832.1 hypothetical protein NDAI_0C01710 [Naumovozyma dairenensis CBS 421]
MWSVIYFTFCSLLFFVNGRAKELQNQTNVPAILFSYKRSPGISDHQKNYDLALNLPVSDFMNTSEELLDHCNSNAYVFINQPGLRKLDFLDFKKHFIFLQKYIYQSSNALKFEKVDILPNDTFHKLMEHVKDKCDIKKTIKIKGNVTEDFEPYYDVDRRVIRIDYPPLPLEREERQHAIESYDLFLRFVLAQLPSPELTVIYTSLEPGEVDPLESIIPVEIFPEIFKNKIDEEKNDRIKEPEPVFNEFRPRFLGMTSKYISIFDPDFIKENIVLLQGIVTSVVGFIMVQVFLYLRKDTEQVKIDSKNVVEKEPRMNELKTKTRSTAENNNEEVVTRKKYEQ